ncbi:GntR family transcriptional regulator [Roseomonas sp. HJA6]|uniref:GntR family transcriptional regulator n=1 Tax=Roseomonas alba TaxID=2846776 RepID=A0ABS7A3H7_9PROT|nr:GntR family transcriptional regulator [Neoroseomonas alba]MBW6396839.1 GntR family transcriptional regulator [Neoroseomonas alba]
MRPQVPKYVTIKALLEARWEREMLPGDRLPSENELCATFRVSRATVQQALALFEGEGVIRRDQGRGTFYVGPREPRTEQEPSRLLETTIRDREGTETRILRRSIQIAPARIAQRLGLARGDRVVTLERLGIVEGAPIVFIYSYLPLEVGMKVYEAEDQLRRMSLAAVLNDLHGCDIVRVQQVIAARLSDPSFSAELGVDVGVPVLEGERTYYSGDGQPVFCTVSYYRGDRHYFTMSVTEWR